MTLREKLELAGYRLRAASTHMPTEWQMREVLSWADDAIRAAQVDRSPEGQDAEERLDRNDESAVGSEADEAPVKGRNND